jgi:pimeloyl-ACP methyl ester carboxylesterase
VKNYLTAIDEMIDHFGSRPTIVLGHSRGGTMAILSGIRNPHVTHFIAVMSHYGPSERPDTTDAFYTSHRDIPPGTERTKEQKRITIPMTYFDDDTQYVGLETCTKPKLFFFGTRDVLVTPEDVQETYALASEPKQLHTLNSVHDYRLQPEIIDEVNRVTADFLASHQ